MFTLHHLAFLNDLALPLPLLLAFFFWPVRVLRVFFGVGEETQHFLSFFIGMTWLLLYNMNKGNMVLSVNKLIFSSPSWGHWLKVWIKAFLFPKHWGTDPITNQLLISRCIIKMERNYRRWGIYICIFCVYILI